MNKKITIWCIGVLIALFAFPVEKLYSTIKKPMRDSVFYYLKIDTAGVDLGYMRMDVAGKNLTVDNVKGDYAMWNVKEVKGVGNLYVLVNKMSGDTLQFAPPVTVEDTIATIVGVGRLKFWDELVFNEDSYNNFLSSFIDEVTLKPYKYYLSMNSEGKVMLSSDTSSLQNNKLSFFVERVVVLPDENKFYRFVVDTLGFPDITDVFTKWNVLSVDTTIRYDSLTVTDTLSGGDLALWYFKVDTVVNDTTFFEIRNKGTDSLLAFDFPINGIDTVAYIDTTGLLNQWRIPFFIEESGIGRFMVRDTVSMKDYYLGLKDSIVMLATKASDVKCLNFVLTDEGYMSNILDSTAVYRVKRLSGDSIGKYLASNERGVLSYIDTVYAHMPDGQFVVHTQNKYHLVNRIGNINTAKNNNVAGDSLKVVFDNGLPVRYHFSNGVDTFEITPITYGNFNALKPNASLGYKALTQEDLSDYSFVFSSNSIASLKGNIMGYNPVDSTLIILADGDSARFLLQHHGSMLSTGALAIGQIPRIERNIYSLRSLADTTLFIAKKGSDIVMDTLPNRAMFYLKEDTLPGSHYFVEYNTTPQYKLLINSSKRLNLAAVDSIETHSFIILQKLKDPEEPTEPDNYNYLTIFPDIRGKGYYEFRIVDPLTLENKWLTKNFYDYAVLGKEGESMLRAGSYTPFDLHLWVDTARGTEFNPTKPSFYIVKDVDTTVTNFDDFKIEGYFLHVMDSISLASHDEYVYTYGNGDEFYRADFVKAKRYSANELLLKSDGDPQLRDSVGFAGKNKNAINEYRFYLQETGDSDGLYYIVTEAGYGDGGRTNARGYLSVSALNGRIYFGLRANAVKVSFAGSTVSNEVVKPPVIEEIEKNLSITGGTGQIIIRNAANQEVVVFNILGQSVIKKILSSDNELLPASRGIMIVKVGTRTQKIIVK